MAKYRLIDYFDVWGNPDDGWTVNDSTTIKDDIVIEEDARDEEIIDILVQIGYLNPEARETIHLEDYGSIDTIEIIMDEIDCPLGRLEVIV